ncbi:glycosyltransferase family 39 protein [Polyangium jinanense]|uniref:Glycosyltransferase family 39 protein n=1 Tax=Polyangium jinanense TaxID=2829994 RepID=A0A9X3X8U9_9BACT|nr:glycosyltransferase family 39 protein [Polyangium jinanense]MDC3962704.1 glycosyltransferase family 39 protein [Polyangium jinanense]MDC3984910.1 glycosyltransferase family 39 protein [Polyangium jinanense]
MEAVPESAQGGTTRDALPNPATARAPSLAVWSRPFALAVAAVVLFSTLGKSGIWDPYELDAADLSRRIAIHVFHADKLALPDAINQMPTLSDLRMGELPFTSMALGFRLFGLADWTGRLPLAIWAFVGVVALHELLARLSGKRAALYGAVALATTPLYFMQARTMLGDIVTMSSLSIAFAGLVGALFDRARGTKEGAEVEVLGTRTWIVKGVWLLVGALGLAAGYMSRGLLIGVAVPALAAGLTWLVLELGGFSAGRSTVEHALGALSLIAGLVALGLGISLLLRTSPDAPLPRALAVALTKKSSVEATFDRTIRHLGHALFPWSAFLPFALGRLFRAPVELDVPARRREVGLRVALLVGAAVAYAVYAALTPHVVFLPWSGVALLAGVVGLAVADFDRGAPPSRALALGVALLAFVLYRDMVLDPGRMFSVFEVDKPVFPKSFEHDATTLMRVSAAAFAALVAIAWFEGRADKPGTIDQWAAGLADDYRKVSRELTTVWNGNLFFAAVVVEAALVGLGAMLFVGTRLGWASVQRLPRNFIDAGLNLWWAVPLVLAIAPISLATLRDGFRAALGLTRLPRGAGVLLAALAAGAVLSFGYYPALAAQLSPKEVFDAYARLQKPGEPLALLGVRARSIAYYHQGGEVAQFNDPAEAFKWLTEGTDRRWLIVRAEELPRLNSLHRKEKSSNLPVLDARSSQILLVSSDLGGQRNENPLGALVLDEPLPPELHVVDAAFEDQLDVLGWEVRDGAGTVVDSVVPQRKYHMRFHYRVVKPITGSWKAFLHIDGFQRRYNGDHTALDGKYAMNLWQPNDIVVDDYVFELEPNFTPGDYTVYFGFFSGDTRFRVTRGPNHENRVIGGALRVR